MLAFILRSIGALIASLLVVFVLIMAVEIFSNVVHPLPEGTNITHEEICLHVAKYPAWVLAVVIPMWGATATVGTWIAQRLGNLYTAMILGVLLIAGVSLNVSMLPYPIWFKVATMLVVPFAALAGSRLGKSPVKSLAPI